MPTRPKVSAAVLRDKGVPIVLDDHKVTLCMSFAALAILEEKYGSVQGVVDAVQGGDKAPAFTTILHVMAAALCHEAGRDGENLSDPDNLVGYLDPGEIATYSEQVGECFTIAFPDKKDDDEGAQEDESGNSRGASGIGSPVSTSPSPMMSSGG